MHAHVYDDDDDDDVEDDDLHPNTCQKPRYE